MANTQGVQFSYYLFFKFRPKKIETYLIHQNTFGFKHLFKNQITSLGSNKRRKLKKLIFEQETLRKAQLSYWFRTIQKIGHEFYLQPPKQEKNSF